MIHGNSLFDPCDWAQDCARHRWRVPCDLRTSTTGNVNYQDPTPLS